MTVAASHLLSPIRSRLSAPLYTTHPLHIILRTAAFVALVIFICGYVQKPYYPCEHVQPFLLPDDPNENTGLFRNEVLLEVRDEDEIRSAQIRRLSEVMGDLEERYGYDELKKGIRLGGQVNTFLPFHVKVFPTKTEGPHSLSVQEVTTQRGAMA